MTIVLSTDHIVKHERLDYWKDAVCSSYVPLECETPTPRDFNGSIELSRMSKISTSYVSGSRQIVRRRKRDIGRATDASFLVSLQLRASGVLRQADREALLRPGDFALYSSIDRYLLDLPDGFKQFVLQIPREDLLRRLPNADLLTGLRVPGDSEIGTLVNDNISRLMHVMRGKNELTMQCMQDTIVDLIASGLASVSEAKLELSRPEQQVILRAMAFLRANLDNPDLDRNMLAKAMGLSVRRLSEIFRADDRSIATTIKELRLRQVAQDLKNPLFARQSISELSLKWGNANLQSFSRMFRAYFGVSPSEYRRKTRAPNVSALKN